MTRPRRPRGSLADRVDVPRPWAWTATTVLLLAVAAGLGLLRVKPLVTNWVVPYTTTLMPDELATTALAVVAALAAIAALLALRRALYARLAERPGPLEVVMIESDEKQTHVRAADVFAEFRRTLAAMSLSAPELVPNAPASDGVLDDVRETVASDSSRNWVATVALLFTSLLRVRHAYRVSIHLRGRAPRDPCEMTVHVVRLPDGRGTVQTISSRDWHRTAQKAAHLVGAFVVPRSRLGRRAPWTAWRGLDMPLELFHRSQQAAGYIRDRHYERALHALHDALELDPQNPYLRIQLGQVQEQLGLYLDATVTYADIVAVEAWHDRRLWRRLRAVLDDDTTGAPPARTPGGGPQGREALLIARYRLVARLSAARQLVEQLRLGQPDRNPLRDEESRLLRDRVVVWLRMYARDHAEDHPPRTGTAGPEVAADLLDMIESRPGRLTHLLRYVALREADALLDDYRWTRGRRVPRQSVSQTGLALLRLATRLQLDESAEAADVDPVDPWPRQADDLDVTITHVMGFKPARATDWKEHYNAACVVSVALGGADDDERTKLGYQAVRHLERAVSMTDSGYVSRYAQWLSTGDPDLNPLRRTPAFTDFLDRYLPNVQPRVLRPGEQLLRLVMSFHTLRLLASVARVRAIYWADLADDDENDLRREHEREPHLVRLVARYAENDRHWQTRSTLITEAEWFRHAHTLPGLRTDLPRFQDDPAVQAVADGRRDIAFDDVIRARQSAWTVSIVPLIEAYAAGLHHGIDRAGAADFWHGLCTRLDAATQPAPPATDDGGA